MNLITETLNNGAQITLDIFEGCFISAHITTTEGHKLTVCVDDCNPEAWEQALSEAEELAGCTAPTLRAELFGADVLNGVLSALISGIEDTKRQAQRYPHMLPYLTEETRRLTDTLNRFSALL